MRSVAIALCSLMIFLSTVKAQDTTTTRLEHVGFVLGASLVFSLGDYLGFNLLKYSEGNFASFRVPVAFRIIEGTAQAAITYFLYKECGLNSAISFDLIWWTWGDDIAYYGWSYLIDQFPWESRSTGLLPFSEYNSAGWTPIGLVRPQGSYIARSSLVAQAIIGLSVSMTILW